jgi:NHLM bacteriocin system ABC transporter ATP-binding protein
MSETIQLKPGKILYLDDREQVFNISKGYLDIFVAGFRNGKIEKKQISVGRCNTGDKIFCFNIINDAGTLTSPSPIYKKKNKDANVNYRLIALINNHVGLKIEEYSIFEDNYETLYKSLNKWLKLIISLAPNDDSKRTVKYLENSDLAFNTGDFISNLELGWIKATPILKQEETLSQLLIPDNAPFLPIFKNIVYQVSDKLDIEMLDTLNLLRKHGLDPIRHLVKHFLKNLKVLEVIQSQAEKNKFYQHIKSKNIDLASTYIQAKSVTESNDLLKDIITVTDGSSKLTSVVNAVGKQFGINIKKTKADLQDFDTFADFIKFIGSENNFFVRQIKVEEEWWRKDGLPFIGFEQETSKPVAVIVKHDKYNFLNTENRKLEKVGRDNCNKIVNAGFTLHPVFNEDKISIRHLLKLTFLGSKKDFLLLIFSGLLVAMLGMFTPFAMSMLISYGIIYSDIPIVIQLLLALLAAAFASYAFYLVKEIAILRVDVRSGSFLQSAIIDRLFKMPVQLFRKYSAGDMATRALGIERIQKTLTGANINAFLGGIFSISSLIMMIYYSAKLSIVGIVMVFVVIIVTAIISIKQFKYMKAGYDLFGEASGISYQIFNGLAKLKIMDRETLGFFKWSEIYSKYCTNNYLSKKLGRNEIISESFIHSASQVAIFLLIGLLIKKKINVPEFVAFLIAFGQFSGSIKTFTSVISSILPIKPIYDRMKPILENKPEIADSAKLHTDFLGNIELYNLSFRYTKESPYIIYHSNMKIDPGEFIAIVGPSGSGKSTLFRLILGLEKPEQGAIFFDGQDISGLNLREFRRSIGVVNQNAKIIPGNIYENITGGGQYSEEEAWNAAELAGLKEDIERFPMKMHTMISENAGTFSGGQKQRMVIARALIKRPKILLLDEATSALDNKTQSIITSNLTRMNVTRVVIAHRLSTIKRADRIYVLKDANFAEIGNYDELMTKKGFFYELAKRQLV